MEAAGLLLGVLVSAPSAMSWVAPWLGSQGAIVVVLALAAAAPVVLAAAAGMLLLSWWRRRRRPRTGAAPAPDPAHGLKELLRRRLAESPEAFAPFAATGPTVGAGEVVERDLDAAAEAVLPQAGWRRGIARHALRQGLNGHAPPGTSVASEAARWRQLGALALIDDANDALAAYSRAADLAPEDADLQLLVGVLYLRTGRLEVAEAKFRRLLERYDDGTDVAEPVVDDKADAVAVADGKTVAEAAGESKVEKQTATAGDAGETAPLAETGPVPMADTAPDTESKAATEAGTAEATARAAIRYRAGTMLGDVLLAKGEREAALAAYETAQHQVVALAEQAPDNPRWRRDTSVVHDRIGDVLLANGQATAALTLFGKSLAVCKALAEGEPANAARQHDLSVAYDRVGEALTLLGNLDGALECCRQGLAAAEASARLEPSCAGWRWDVSASHERIGDLLSVKGKTSDALAAYRLGLETAEALAAADPVRVDWQRDLAVSCHKIGLLEAQLGHEAEAREALEQGRAIVARLAEVARYQAQWRADMALFNSAIKGLEQ
jgi:tetratricopeptide (TPR) repeat protein